jgi:hypothetical protein
MRKLLFDKINGLPIEYMEMVTPYDCEYRQGIFNEHTFEVAPELNTDSDGNRHYVLYYFFRTEIVFDVKKKTFSIHCGDQSTSLPEAYLEGIAADIGSYIYDLDYAIEKGTFKKIFDYDSPEMAEEVIDRTLFIFVQFLRDINANNDYYEDEDWFNVSE